MASMVKGQIRLSVAADGGEYSFKSIDRVRRRELLGQIRASLSRHFRKQTDLGLGPRCAWFHGDSPDPIGT
jgi:hypothetical protein